MSERRRSAKKPPPEKQGKTVASDGNSSVKRETPVQFSVSMICTLIAALFILTFNVQAFEIPSGSMERTLLVGDHLLVNRSDVGPRSHWARFLPHHVVKDGDILVFLSPAQHDLHLVKRIVGVPGDRLRLQKGRLIRNGQVVSEPYVVRNGTYVPYRDDFPTVPPNGMDGLTPEWNAELQSYVHYAEIEVPPGHYFAMGDNRDNSYDSRYWGFVPEQNIIGRPLIIYWSFEDSEDEYQRDSPSERIAHTSRVVRHFFDQTRWDRTFMMPR